MLKDMEDVRVGLLERLSKLEPDVNWSSVPDTLYLSIVLAQVLSEYSNPFYIHTLIKEDSREGFELLKNITEAYIFLDEVVEWRNEYLEDKLNSSRPDSSSDNGGIRLSLED